MDKTKAHQLYLVHTLSHDTFICSIKLIKTKDMYGLLLKINSNQFVPNEIKKVGIDYFEAFEALFEELSALNIVLCCKGSQINTWPSGGLRDSTMGLGLYELVMGSKQLLPINILEPSTGFFADSWNAKQEFHKKWVESVS